MNELYNFFNSEKLDEEAMYYAEMHGFLTSLAAQPGELTQEQILKEIFVDNSFSQTISDAIFSLIKDIEQTLLNGDFPDVIESEEDEDSLTLWATGFMQGVFTNEATWFATFPEEVAELTLPILSCSELLDDELSEINHDEDLLDAMAEKIPDCVISLYLLFNTPE